MADSLIRLQSFLTSRGQPTETVRLTADASTREYFRISWDGQSAVACVYPDSFDTQGYTFLDVTRLFLASGLPVADVMDFDGPLGVIIQEDLGDRIFRDEIATADAATATTLINEAISMIARIQSATHRAFEMGSVASKLKFDREKLLWELDYFKLHYFETLMKRPLSEADNKALFTEFDQLATALGSRASVLCHRDFHAANLMIDKYGRIRIIDHQDARLGSPAYDLVSLLLDRINVLPSEDWIAEKQAYLLSERSSRGLETISDVEYAREFDLQTIQRCLKAVGTFSYQSTVRGKTHFASYIASMFQAVLRGIGKSQEFRTLKLILEGETGLSP